MKKVAYSLPIFQYSHFSQVNSSPEKASLKKVVKSEAAAAEIDEENDMGRLLRSGAIQERMLTMQDVECEITDSERREFCFLTKEVKDELSKQIMIVNQNLNQQHFKKHGIILMKRKEKNGK